MSRSRAARCSVRHVGSLLVVDGAELGEAAIGGPLSVQTFARLRVVFGRRKTGRPTDTGRYPFGPLLRCSRCGNKLTGIRGWKDRGYYACRNPHKVNGVTIGRS